MGIETFHPAVSGWFRGAFDAPTEAQERAWPELRRGRHVLVSAPTGSGKTLAAFLSALDDLVQAGLRGELEDGTRVVYVSPLKALSNDVRKNLEEPLAGIRRELVRLGLPDIEIRTLVRTGDTPSSERASMRRRPPHVLVTTPESLYILLTSESGRAMLRRARTVIVDEIHALAGSKRGSHLALTLERLGALAGSLQRIGLSATQRPIEEVARFLSGGFDGEVGPAVTVVETGLRRNLDLAIEVPGSPLEAVMAGEVWTEVYDRLAALARQHRTTLVFVNTRRMSERVARHLEERLGEGAVTAHHGSLSRERRLEAERRLKAGELRALVATASLELGIDIGSVDLVCQLGSTRSISTLLQRAGRSEHHLGGRPKARVFPLSRDELVECTALLRALRDGDLDRIRIPERALDVLAQQIVAAVACEEWSEEGLFALVRRAFPYRRLERSDFDDVVRMLAEGFTTRRGRRAAHLHHDLVHGRLRARRGARLAAITSGGAIPDRGDFHVVLEPGATLVGSVHEDFAIESLPGNIFQLGNASWRILRIEPGRVVVEDARGEPPTIPFWLGEAPGRTDELSAAVSALRGEAETLLRAAPDTATGVEALCERLREDPGLPRAAALQVAEYLAAGSAALGALPTEDTVVAERFFDEAGDMHLVLHSPRGSRLNRAWGLALRKRFCQTFNFELQAAATEEAIVLSLGPTHSFPLESVFGFLRTASVREVLVQAVLDAPLFPLHWRWNASRALALLRFRGGRHVPPRLQRQEAEDLIAVVFPEQLACLENIAGAREVPDHPLVGETLRDCLEEAMDVEGLERLLGRFERGEMRLVARDLTEPSPLALEVLAARPYAFLDDAPLEERRTQAVRARRFLDPESAADLGALDAAAIAAVTAEAWPRAESPDELHEALVLLGLATQQEGRQAGWLEFFEELAGDGRAAVLRGSAGAPPLWVAAERLPELAALFPDASLDPTLRAPERLAVRAWRVEDAAVEVLRGRLEASGPVTAERLRATSGLAADVVRAALARLESEGAVLRGRFTPGAPGEEWCDRRLLARIHRRTVGRLRREIEPVSRADFLRFLLSWQRVLPEERVSGVEGLAAILDQLEGFEAAAAAWEGEVLPARVEDYDPAWLDALLLSGRFVWGRLTPPAEGGRRAGPVRSTPIAFLRRERLALWRELASRTGEAAVGGLGQRARAVHGVLDGRGASFFADLAAEAGLLANEAEDALAELVARGLAASDTFTGLRALLVPASLRPSPAGGRRRRSGVALGMESAGRWSLLAWPVRATGDAEPGEEAVLAAARALLRRYGVVFRRLLERESLLPHWRDLLRAYWRLEARGEIRGGRFVDGFSGEQFALPEAVERLRGVRRRPADGVVASLSGADPLNLAGIVVPGDRLTALTGNRVLYRDGIPIALGEGRSVRFLVELDAASRWSAQAALRRRVVPPKLRAYLGRTA